MIEELRAEISRLRDKLTDDKFTKTPDREDVGQMEVLSWLCKYIHRTSFLSFEKKNKRKIVDI